jgi:pyridoxal phosphate enzyme (YggS family)
MKEVRDNCMRVLDRIQRAAARAGRDPDTVRLIAVTKTVSIEDIREAIACGIRHIGESKLQEAIPKHESLSDLPVTWHFIGHLQTNKAKKVVEVFDWVQSVDRIELAEKLSSAVAHPLPVLIEVKLHDEPSKSGTAVGSLDRLVPLIRSQPNLDLRGLMAVPPYFEDAEKARPYFRSLRELAAKFGLPEVSMGMSHDFEIAIEEGATMVRVGTAVFGPRQP